MERKEFLKLSLEERAALLKPYYGKLSFVKMAEMFNTSFTTVRLTLVAVGLHASRTHLMRQSDQKAKQEAVAKRYLELGSMEKVGEELGVCRERIRQLCKAIGVKGRDVQKLRKQGKKEEKRKRKNRTVEYLHKPSGQWYVSYIDEQGKRIKTTRSRYIMEKKLGRQLLPTEKVIHRNLDSSDDDLENLIICKNQKEVGIYIQEVLNEIKKETGIQHPVRREHFRPSGSGEGRENGKTQEVDGQGQVGPSPTFGTEDPSATSVGDEDGEA